MVSIGAADTHKRGQRTSVGTFSAALKEDPRVMIVQPVLGIRGTEEAIEGGESPKSWRRTWN